MKNLIQQGPFLVRTSFSTLKEAFLTQDLEGDTVQQLVATEALKIFERNPILEEGFDSLDMFEENLGDIHELMSLLFPSVLTLNEIKCALHPMSHASFYDTKRLANLKDEMVEDFDLPFMSLYNEDGYHVTNFLPYAVILNRYYGFDIDFTRPTTVTLRLRNGTVKKFRATYNADFLSISPNENAIDITPEILDELLLNTGNYTVWEKYFPKNSWLLEGFAILNMVDTTLDEQIDVFKEHLIAASIDASFDVIIQDIREILGIQNLMIGATQIEKNFLIRGYDSNVKSLFLFDRAEADIQTMGCQSVRDQLLIEHKTVILSNVQAYDESNPHNRLRRVLLEQGIMSAAFIPIVIKDEVISFMEIGAKQKNQINDINIIKINDILPFIYSFIERNIVEFDNHINAIIQKECTSIHPSVKWKFEEKAYQFYMDKQKSEKASFSEVVFDNVMPLYGQIDIVGSTYARNRATQNDLTLLLQESLAILKQVTEVQNLPFYEQLLVETEENLDLVKTAFHANTEQIISEFFEVQLYPVLQYFAQSNQRIEKLDKFLANLDNKKSIYLERKNYDAAVDSINQELAKFLDEKQEDAQAIFPHYFQKYKTDGVEHDIYVGQSIAQNELYHESVLYNLRLWQLQIMCEMEAQYYTMQQKYPIHLKVASLIFAYDTPMSIRYRIDEKKFDVDGAYNVRYEMIKKRIDKAHVKNTTERLTQPHKMVVVYFNSNIEREYLNYFKFLQVKGYVGEEIEILDVEDLQGAVGMKALRVPINLNLTIAERVYGLEDMSGRQRLDIFRF